MRKTIFFYLLSLLLPLAASAQNVLTVKGCVVDAEGQRLAAASVVADDGHTATVTNEDGDFLIKVAAGTQRLTVSHLGFATQQVTLGETDSELRVVLRSTSVVLQDILVADPHRVLLMAIRDIPRNYQQHATLQQGFYRETTRKGRRYIYVAEAVTDMYKTGYGKDIRQDRVAIRKARRLVSTQASDTLGAKIAGGPVIPVVMDLVKNLDYLLNEEMLSHYNYSMAPSLSPTDGRSEVVVTIRPRSNAPVALLGGEFYIDVQTLAIRHIRLELDMSDRNKATDFMLERKPAGVRFRPRSLSLQVNYRPDADGRLSLGYIRTDCSFRCDWKRKLFSSAYHVVSEMVTTDCRTDSVQPIRGRDSFRDRESLYDHTEYFGDPAFWEQYNIIPPSESLEKGIRRFLRRN